MVTPVTDTYFAALSQKLELATQRLHRAMQGIDQNGKPIPVSRQLEEINKAQGDVSVAQAALNAYKKLLDVLARAA